jgi:peptide/nickel transport system permease protein
VEYVFSYPGLAGLLVEAATARDYPIVAGVVLVTTVLFVLLNLAADLLRAALDPRVRTA